MATVKHTPGPWELDGVTVSAETYGMIAAVEQPDEEGRANAKLIAAAPDLYEALSNLLAAIPEGTNFYEEERAALAALAKACGDE